MEIFQQTVAFASVRPHRKTPIVQTCYHGRRGLRIRILYRLPCLDDTIAEVVGFLLVRCLAFCLGAQSSPPMDSGILSSCYERGIQTCYHGRHGLRIQSLYQLPCLEDAIAEVGGFLLVWCLAFSLGAESSLSMGVALEIMFRCFQQIIGSSYFLCISFVGFFLKNFFLSGARRALRMGVAPSLYSGSCSQHRVKLL
jgi:hypothetical protein